MPDYKWNFLPARKGEMLADPIQSQFFTTDNVGGVGRALVRESIQNTLDAKRTEISEPVEIHYKFIDVEKSDIEPLFETLVPHLNAENNGIPKTQKTFHKKVRFLIIEDFGTTGLEGNPADYSLTSSNSNNGFFYFWRNIGRSGKSTNNRGRWGLGKTVFPATSKINTFFGITRRVSDLQNAYVLGQAVFKNHLVDEITYTPFGHFGRFGTGEDEHFAMPIQDAEFINAFMAVFDLNRGNEAGLSLAIAMPDSEITTSRLVVAVAEQYFYPILSKKLKVHFKQGTLDHKTLVPLLEKNFEKTEDDYVVDPYHFSRTLNFTQWTMQLPEDQHICLKVSSDLTKSSRWNDYKSRITEEELANIQEIFKTQQRIGFIVPMKVQFIGKEPQLSTFRVYFERDSELPRAENYFIREGITITGIYTLTQRDMRCIVVIDEQPLTTLLGDAENPAHTEWQKDSQNFKDKYVHGASSINFVKFSPKYLSTLLTQTDNKVDKDLLKDIFFLEETIEQEPESKTRKPKKKKRQEVSKKPEIPKIEPPQSPIVLLQNNSGFIVKSSTKPEIKVGRLRVKFAYDARGSNPFKSYSPFDFELGQPPLTVETINGKLSILDGNHLEIEVIDINDDFGVQVQGFDTKRDLIIRTWWEKSE